MASSNLPEVGHVVGPDDEGYWFPIDHPKGGDVPCPDCGGSGRGVGFDRKVESPVSPGLRVWEPPRCERCGGLGTLAVTISGDSENYYLSDDEGRIVSTHATLAAAKAARAGESDEQMQVDAPESSDRSAE